MTGASVSRLRQHAGVLVVFAVGLAIRVVLVPLWHGQDFTVWTLASTASLHGINIYAHHPAYPGGPYAYFPLFLGIEIPLQFLSQHTGIDFVVLGKLPMVAADLAVAGLLYRVLLRRGCSNQRAAVGAAAFLLNPLVLYNSAYYGRFDSLGCLLLLAFTSRRAARKAPLSVPDAVLYGLAVAAKTFPIFVLGAAPRSAKGRWRLLIAVTAAVLLAVSLPYLLTPWPYLRDIIGYDAAKVPTGLSPWTVLNPVASMTVAGAVSSIGLVAFVVGAVLIARRCGESLTVAVAATLVLFLVCSKLVLEQYLVWPMPWLILLAVGRRDALAGRSRVLLVAYTVAGLIDNESFHPLGRDAIPLALALVALNCWYLRALFRRGRNASSTELPETEKGRPNAVGHELARADDHV